MLVGASRYQEHATRTFPSYLPSGFPTLFGVYDFPINIITVVICAILGVLGWALVLIFHLLGIAF